MGVFVLERDGAGYRSTSPTNLVASRDEWSAPIMAEVGPDGNVWIIDWYNYIVQHNPTPYGFETGKGAAYESELRDKKHGRIYRLKYDGAIDASTTAPSSLDVATPAELVAALRHPTKLWRLHAQRLLVERGQLDVAPELIAMIKDNSVDPIGLNVGAIHAIGVLRGLGAFDENALPAATDALYAALGHPSAGVRRNAILALPLNEVSREKLLASSVLRDADAQVKLAAILALSDLPPSRAGAEADCDLVNGRGRERPVDIGCDFERSDDARSRFRASAGSATAARFERASDNSRTGSAKSLILSVSTLPGAASTQTNWLRCSMLWPAPTVVSRRPF